MPLTTDQPQGLLSQPPAPQGGLLSQIADFAGSPLGQGLLSAVSGGLSTAGRKGYGRWNTIGMAGLEGVKGYSAALEAERARQGLDIRSLQQQRLSDQEDRRWKFAQDLLGNGDGSMTIAPAPSALDRPLSLGYEPQGMDQRGIPSLAGMPAPNQSQFPSVTNAPAGPGVPGLPSFSASPGFQGGPSIPTSFNVPRQALAAEMLFNDGKKVGEWIYKNNSSEVDKWLQVPAEGGGLEVVGLDKQGRRVNTGVKPWIEPEWRDGGSALNAIDPVTLEVRRSFKKTLTPAEAAADQRVRENQQWQRDNGSTQIIQTDQGPVVVNTRSGQATPVTGPAGQTYGRSLSPIPSQASTAIITNQQNLAKINDALTLLEGDDVGKLKGDKEATGWKGYLPQAALNRADPNGIDARAMIADLGSLIIHDRSGAAVTAAESPRLMPFIPLITDSRETAVKKLQRFKQLYEAEQQGLRDIYSPSNGYRQPSFGANPQGGSRPPLTSFDKSGNGQANGGQRPPLSSFEGQ
ncbi:hypothetical protein EIP75_05650 [Aquabacterium soli]|uniref:Uncharacterized protein n=1 Tax=Aquabacterium soli TaxID=2493092 RepID=A0A3R8S470_9BURK|nr:hypothetical protein [Aquabacterium soli]RRS05062.1 hypothetical protein EIP75_05650 [Aquabacterium soli]